MLRSLTIQNFALIENTHIQFEKGFHVITGETGSGKSILLGALNQILGERADLSMVRDASKKTIIEATFLLNQMYQPWFEQNDIDFDSETVIRRELSSQGKSRAFINDTPVQLSQLRELTEQLVYIHSQHETLELKRSSFQFDLLDSFSEAFVAKQQVAKSASEVKKLSKSIAEIENNRSEQLKELDYLQFQLAELDQLQLESRVYHDLEQEFARLSQMDDLKSIYAAFANGIDQEEGPLDQLRRLKQLSDKWKNNDRAIAALYERIHSVIIELSDISAEASNLLSALEPDPERVFWLTENIDAYNRALRKHHVNNQSELLEFQKEMVIRIHDLTDSESNLDELRTRLTQLEKDYQRYSDELYHLRSSHIEALENHLLSLIHPLKMEHARIKIQLDKSEVVDAQGGMAIQLLFSANKGLEFKPIEKAASGGELSRLMLAIQATMSVKKELPTLILDEIDTGVSGEVAARIGDLLKSMGQNLQLVVITHLPQVAAKGTTHFEVSKSHAGAQTSTSIHVLNEERRIESIAQLLSGANITDAARISAKELLFG